MVRWTWWDWSLILRTITSFSALTLLVWSFWPVKRVPDMIYNVFSGTLNPAQSINQQTSSIVGKTSRQSSARCPGVDSRKSGGNSVGCRDRSRRLRGWGLGLGLGLGIPPGQGSGDGEVWRGGSPHRYPDKNEFFAWNMACFGESRSAFLEFLRQFAVASPTSNSRGLGPSVPLSLVLVTLCFSLISVHFVWFMLSVLYFTCTLFVLYFVFVCIL